MKIRNMHARLTSMVSQTVKMLINHVIAFILCIPDWKYLDVLWLTEYLAVTVLNYGTQDWYFECITFFLCTAFVVFTRFLISENSTSLMDLCPLKTMWKT